MLCHNGLDEIQIHSAPVIEKCYIEFLRNSQDPDEREYEDDADQIREALIHANYFSLKDVQICLGVDLSPLEGESGYASIQSLHRLLRTIYPPDLVEDATQPPQKQAELSAANGL